MFKDFFVKKMLSRQLKGIPEEQQKKIIALFTRNPETFKRLAEEMQTEMASGKSQQEAAFAVFQRNEQVIRELMNEMDS